MLSVYHRAVLAAASLLACAALQASTLEEIGKAIEEKMASHNSISYEQSTVTEMKSEQFSMSSKMSGTVEMKKKGELWLMRAELEGTSEQSVMGNTTSSQSKMLSITDTEYAYSLSEANGVKQAFKSKLDAEKAKQNWIETMKETMDIKVLPDETVEGEACYVLECRVKDQAEMPPMTYYLAKSCGVPVKMVSNNQMGTTTMTTRNIKLNPSIADDRFVFTAPDGVTVQEQ